MILANMFFLSFDNGNLALFHYTGSRCHCLWVRSRGKDIDANFVKQRFQVAELMRAVNRRDASGHFAWIGSDGWSGRGLVTQGKDRPSHSTLTQASPKVT